MKQATQLYFQFPDMNQESCCTKHAIYQIVIVFIRYSAKLGGGMVSLSLKGKFF